MQQIKNVMMNVLALGTQRKTRSGITTSKFFETVSFDLQKGFPAVTCKKLAMKSMIGELLWFINGETTIDTLQKRSGLSDDAWTIWTDDCTRWHNEDDSDAAMFDTNDLGYIYGSQWREFGFSGLDQLELLIEGLKSDPYGRRHIVSAWNPEDLDSMALAPCHTSFQCYVREVGGEKYLDLIWHQRSVDVFLGLPFNIASYAALTHILASICGYKVGMLHGTLGDCHIYEQHGEACRAYLDNECLELCDFVMPKIERLSDLENMTASDFSLNNYNHHGAIKAKLSVG